MPLEPTWLSEHWQSDDLPWYRVNVKSSTPALPPKQRSTSTGTLVGTRFQPALLAAVDEWRKEQPDLPTRPEAVRRLVELGLKQPEDGANGRFESGQTASSSLRSGKA
jgi:hypothetical protein